MKILIIGGGNIGTAIAKGIKEADSNKEVVVTRRNTAKIESLKALGIQITTVNTQHVADADVIILAIKPHQTDDILKEILPFINKQIIVSVVTGKEIKSIKNILGDSVHVFRAMPNTAISQKESMTCLAYDRPSEMEMQIVDSLFRSIGESVFIEEKLMDAATVLCACGIAFALRYIRAAMQAGIQIGFDSNTALKIVSQTVKGASALLLNNQTHPESEIDKVTTPQGCTIVGLNEMEHQGFSSSLIQGIQHSYNAIENMKKK